MANKKINELDSRATLTLSDLMAVGDPSTGYLYKTTISDLKTLTGAGVVSFNGRIGTVVPVEGDYSLTQLSDVIITSASNNQVLRYNGSNWVNATIDLSGYVPYTGATGNVNLGSNTLLAAQIKATSSAGLSINANSGTQIADLGAGGGANMTLYGGLTGTSASFSSSVTGNTIVKTGGTSSQFLKADGSVDSSTYLTTSAAASTYLPLSGGTLTGGLYGTSAEFSGSLLVTGDTNLTGRLGAKFGIIIEKGNTPATLSLLDVYISASSGPTNSLKIQNTNYLSTLNFPQSNQTFTFPEASGTIALTSALGDYVTLGTTQTISGVKTFTTSNLFSGANLFTTFSQRFDQGVGILETANFGASSGYTNIVGAVNGLALRLSSDGKKIFAFADATTNNTFTFPNATGTVALTTDLGSYLPLAGGTLSGALNGTSAVFSSTIQASAYRLTGMTAGSGALYWASDRVTLANYNASGLVHIEANGGAGVATFGGATYNNDFVGTGRFTGALTGTSATFSGDLIIDTNTLYVDSTNNRVGIGIIPTDGSLHINAGTGQNFTVMSDGTNSIAINNFSTASGFQQLKVRASVFTVFTGTAGGGTATQRFTITEGGNVGIGTSSPAGKLEINGLTFINNTGDTTARLLLRNSTTTAASGGLDIQQIGVDASLNNASNGYLSLSTNNTERMRITSAGSLGLNSSSPFNPGGGGQTSFEMSGINYSTIYLSANNATVRGQINADNLNAWVEVGARTNHPLVFNTNNTERMRITSGGNVCIGTTAAVEAGLLGIKQNATVFNLVSLQNTSTIGNFIYFVNSGGSSAGNIANSAGGVLYLTSSDYRLKQDFKDYNGLNLISKIKTYDYELKCDSSRMYGVKAHELQEIIPYAVNGEKDAKQMQSVDYSKLVPILVKAIQELKAEIETLKNI